MATVAQNKLAKRIKLLDAACDLFVEKGINTTAIDEVVKLAGVAKGTFYLYFQDKYDLLDQIIAYKSTQVFYDIFDEMNSLEKSEKMSCVEKSIWFFDKVVSRLKASKEFVPIVSKNLSVCYAILDTNEPNKQSPIQMLTEGLVAEGHTHDGARRKLYILFNSVGTVCCEAIIKGRPYTVDELLPEVHRMIRTVLSGGKAT